MNRDKVGCWIAGVGVFFCILGCMLHIPKMDWTWITINLLLLALNTRNFLYHYRDLGK